jgi:DNA-binding NarL/FixJ family response regulator
MRIVIADDQGTVRRGVRALLTDNFPGVICDEAQNGAEAVNLVRANRPDLVILDISMPLLDGFGAAAQIQEFAGHVPILFFSSHSGNSFIDETRRVGAQGFVSKDDASEVLVEAVRTLLQRKTFSPAFGG